MSVSTSARRYSSQPTSISEAEVDWTHPWTTELQLASFATEERTFFNIAQGTRFNDPYAPAESYSVLRYSKNGRGKASYQGGNSNQGQNIRLGNTFSQQTILACVRCTADFTNIASTILTGTDNGGWYLGSIVLGPNNKISGGAVYTTAITSDINLVNGEYYVIAYSGDFRSSSPLQKMFINGVKQSTTTASNSLEGRRLVSVSLGTAGPSYCVDIMAVFAWSRAMSDRELESLTRNPYQVIRRKARTCVTLTGAIQAQLQKALYMNGQGYIMQSPGGLNVKPLVMVGTDLRERLASEGIPVVFDQGKLRQLLQTETLLI